jgi:hypothetical protein
MRIVNVIVSHPETPVVSIDSFGVFEEQLSQEVVEEAEDLFIEKCVKLKFGETTNETREDLNERNFFREEVAESLDDGYMDIGETTVSIVWSDI